jgi:uncharacterized repeat protein (TIGR01451 family)
MLIKYTSIICLFTVIIIAVPGMEDNAGININKFIIAESDNYVVYWISVANSGDTLLKNVRVIDKFPNEMAYLDSEILSSYDQARLKTLRDNASPRKGDFIWGLGDFQKKENRWIRLMAKKVMEVPKSSDNIAYAIAVDPSSGLMHTHTRARYPLASMLDTNSIFTTPIINNKADYIVTVSNKGTKSISKVVLEVNLAKDLQFINAIPAPVRTPDPESKMQTLFWSLGDMSPGKEYSIILTANITSNNGDAGDLRNTKVLSAAFVDDKLTIDGYKSSAENKAEIDFKK